MLVKIITMLEELLHVGDRAVVYNSLKFSDTNCSESDKICTISLCEVKSESEVVFEKADSDSVLYEKQCYIVYLYSANKIYRCSAYFMHEFEREGKNCVILQIVSPLEKVQRRNYQRFTCHEKISYAILEKGKILEVLSDIKDSNEDIKKRYPFCEERLADISGGGMRFISKENIEKDTNILCIMNITKDKQKISFHIVARVVDARPLVNDKDRFDIRVKYIGIDEKKREEIIKFSFRMERKGMM